MVFSESTLPIISGPNGVESRELIFKIAKKSNLLDLRFEGHAYKLLTFHRSKKYLETKNEGMDWCDGKKIYRA